MSDTSDMSNTRATTRAPIAILLGAGDGTRMGGSKARLIVGGEPLAKLHAERARDAGCDTVILVTRPEIAPLFEPPRFAAIKGLRVATSTARDPSGSLAVGLRASGLGAGVDADDGEQIVLVTPIDALPARPETIALLFAAVRGGLDAATPRHGGRGGHPIVARARVLLEAAASALPLRDVLAALGVKRLRVDVDDPAIGTDMDTPADVIAVTGAPPRFWG
jgi:molybdenum cofactor cytidylyltransferase